MKVRRENLRLGRGGSVSEWERKMRSVTKEGRNTE